MKMLFKLLTGFGVLLGMLFPNHTKASHMMGADMTWKCLGGDSFMIIATVYRDCNGIPLSNAPFSYYGDCGGFSAVQNLAGTMGDGKDITPTCKETCTRCSDASCGNQFGIQQWTIAAIVVFPKGCCHWKVSWQQSARNTALTTLQGGLNFYTEVEINTCLKSPCDNSPYFTIPPIGIFCLNQCVVMNPGATDDDRDVNGQPDSISYRWGQPEQAENSNITYNPPYTYKEPLKYTGDDPDADFNPPHCLGMHLDPQTGDIEFRATKEDQTVMVILVDEYRKDSLGIYRLIGTTRRDIQVAVIDCKDNNPPVITGINGGTENSIKICADKQTCFNIKSFDIDKNDTVQLTWNSQIAGATFSVDKKKWPTGTFCWRPGDKDVRSYPYRFIAMANDDHCLVPGRASRAFSIYVISSPKAVYSAIVQKCGMVYFNADPAPDTKASVSEYLWTGEGSPGYGPLYIHKKNGYYQYTRPGTYHYTLTVTSANGCSRSYTDSVKIDPFVQVSLPHDTAVCERSLPITITATPNLAKKPFSISWNTGATGDQITQKIIKDTVFVAYIKDATGCTNYDSMRVKMQKLPRPDLGPDRRGCWGHTVALSTGLKHLPVTDWTHIKGKDTVRNYMHGDTVNVNDSGTYAVYVKDSLGCPGADTANVYFNPLVKVTPLDTDVCLGDSVPMKAGSAGPDASITWIDVVHQKTVATGPRYTVPKATNTIGGYHYLVVIKQIRNGVICTDSGQKDIRVHNLPKPQLKPLPDKCIDDNAFALQAYVDQAHKGGGWYYPRNPAAIVNGYLYPAVMGNTKKDPALGWVHYLYIDQYKCTSNDSIHINISSLPQVSAGPDKELCTANGRYILSNGFVAPSGGDWIPMPGTPKDAIEYSAFRDTVFFNPAKVPLDTVYGIIYSVHSKTGSTTCNNSDTVHLTVKTNPVISITRQDTLCDAGDPVQLSAQPGGGMWSILDATPAASLSYDAATGAYMFDPAKAGGGSHKLAYTAWADRAKKMCAATDSTAIFVVTKPNATFTTQDGLSEYCITHAPVKLVPNKNWPGGVFSGNAVYNTGADYFFDPAKADPTDADKNMVSYIVPYDRGRCRLVVTQKITVDLPPAAQILTPANQCEGQTSFELKAQVSQVTQWAWSDPNGGPVAAGQLAGNTISTTYQPTGSELKARQFWIYLRAWNGGKCTDARDSVHVIIHPNPVPDFTGDSIGCAPLAVNFNSSYSLAGTDKIARYTWDFGDGTAESHDRNAAHTFAVTNGQSVQHYTVKLSLTTAGAGCTGTVSKPDFITVHASPAPVITADPQYTTIALPKIQFDVDEVRSRGIDFKDPATAYLWSFGDSGKDHPAIRNPWHTYGDTGHYLVKLNVISNGCPGNASVDVIVKPELIIYIPNVFKPDSLHGGKRGDNVYTAWVNQTFQPVVSGYATFQMDIYNRWGEHMYSTISPDKGWNGRCNGQDAMEGVYVYVIKATSLSGKPYTFTGSVTLLR